MMKHPTWIVFVGLSLVAFVHMFWTNRGDGVFKSHYDENLIDGEACNRSNMTPEILADRGWKRIDFSKWPSVNVTAAQSNEIAVALAGVVGAYTNAQHQVLKSKIASLPDRLLSVESFSYQRLMSPVWRVVNSFLHKLEYENYDNSVVLASRMQLGITMIRFACDLEARRETGSAYARQLEWRLLRQMQVRVMGFCRLGRNELAREMQRYIDEWIVQIESDGGYTRRYAWLQVSAQYGHITDGSWTVWQLFRIARLQASGLIKECNYRPKWLDKDFPIPKGMKDLWEKQ